MSGNYKGSGYFFSSGGEDASTSEQSTENQSGGGGWGFGSFLSSVTSKIKDVIEAEKSQFEEEQRKVAEEASKLGVSSDDTPKQKSVKLPWDDVPDTVGETIRGLTKSKRTFLENPPKDAAFEFDLEEWLPVAQAALEADQKLNNARFYLVPKFVREPRFWRNYFYRVHLIKLANGIADHEVSNADKESAAQALEREAERAKEVERKKEEKKKRDAEEIDEEAVSKQMEEKLAANARIMVAPTREFVSDEIELGDDEWNEDELAKQLGVIDVGADDAAMDDLEKELDDVLNDQS